MCSEMVLDLLFRVRSVCVCVRVCACVRVCDPPRAPPGARCTLRHETPTNRVGSTRPTNAIPFSDTSGSRGGGAVRTGRVVRCGPLRVTGRCGTVSGVFGLDVSSG